MRGQGRSRGKRFLRYARFLIYPIRSDGLNEMQAKQKERRQPFPCVS
nr:MAG TPA: hypothetical protein [Caudoviricetes sp.]